MYKAIQNQLAITTAYATAGSKENYSGKSDIELFRIMNIFIHLQSYYHL